MIASSLPTHQPPIPLPDTPPVHLDYTASRGRVLGTYHYQQAETLGETPPPRTYSAVRKQAELKLKPSKPSDGAVSYSARNTLAYLETVASAKTRELNRQGGAILPLDHDRSSHSNGGYTARAMLPNGKIFCINYIVDDAPMAQIRGCWFDEDDF